MNAKALTAGVAVAAAVGVFSLPASAATAISGAVNAVANSSINNVTTSDQQSKSWSGAPATLDASVSSHAINGDDKVSTQGEVLAAWSSANAGSIRFFNYGWEFSVNDPTTTEAASDLTQGRGGDDWTYTFMATQNGAITMNYNVTAAENPFGLWGWSIDWSGPGGGLPVSNPFDPTTSGVFTRALVAGQTYTIGLNGNPNVAFPGPTGSYDGLMQGGFTFAITGANVPEPATWAMMLFGIAAIGAGLRLNRAKTLTDASVRKLRAAT